MNNSNILFNLLILQYIHLPIQLSIWLQTKANYLPSLDVICVLLNVNTKKLYNHSYACNKPPLTPSSYVMIFILHYAQPHTKIADFRYRRRPNTPARAATKPCTSNSASHQDRL